MEPPLVDVGIQRNVTRITQNPSDFPNREPVTQQFFDPHEVLIKLAFLQGALGLSQQLTLCLFSYNPELGFHTREGQAPSGPTLLDRHGPAPNYWESTEAVSPSRNRPRYRQNRRLG
jgi:hypothetical protein